MSSGFRMSAKGNAPAPRARAGDFAANSRLLILSVFAVVIGLTSTAGAILLLGAIRLFTNIFYDASALLPSRLAALGRHCQS